jgi:hypothetical protein
MIEKWPFGFSILGYFLFQGFASSQGKKAVAVARLGKLKTRAQLQWVLWQRARVFIVF